VIDPDFLTVDDLIRVHEMEIEKYGGLDGLRDKALLESAIGMPQASFGGAFLCEDLFTMAAAYAYHIAQNQPFLDGNKRTGLAAALLFLEFNGTVIEDPAGCLYDAMIAVSERRLDKAGLAVLLRDLARSVH